AAMYEKGVQVYIAPTADARDTWLASMRHIAAEGRCFVLSCNQYSTKDMYPEEIVSREEFKDASNELTRGGSCVVDHLGEYIVDPIFGDEKKAYDDIDIDIIMEDQYDFDILGHS